MSLPSLRRAAPVAALAFVLAGCAHAKAGPRPDELEPGGTVITREQIDGMQGARTALEVVERSAKHLIIQRTRQGTPVRIYQRGIGSIYIAPDIQVVVDGTLVNEGVNALSNILVQHVETIQILNSREATTKYGANGGNGVIIVRTTAG